MKAALHLCTLALWPALAHASSSEDLLLGAIRSGDHAAAALQLQAGANPDHRQPDGSTLLAWAVDSQDPAMVQLLLAAGAKVDDNEHPAAAPLMMACDYGSPEVLELLLAAGASTTATRPDGISALALCAGHAPTAVVEKLVAGGAAVDAADADGQTPLMHAAASGNIDTIKLLLARGADANRVTAKGFTPLMFALTSGVTAAADTILDAGGAADYVAPNGTTIVQMAMYQGDYAFAARLAASERGVDLAAFDRNGNQLLHAAVLAHQPELAELLLAKGADPNAMTDHSKVEWRFERNFTSRPYYMPLKPALVLAAERGDAEMMRVLAAAGADVNLRAEDGTSVVLAAAASGTLVALEAALEFAPDANVTNNDGDTPLHLLLNSSGRTDGTGAEYGPMMKLLAERGARPDLANKRGKTPAAIASEAPVEPHDAFIAAFGQIALK